MGGFVFGKQFLFETYKKNRIQVSLCFKLKVKKKKKKV